MKINLSSTEADLLLEHVHEYRRSLELDLARGIDKGKDVTDIQKKLELIRGVIPKLAGNAR